MAKPKICIFNWSGGKDSTLALHYALQDPELEIRYLVTTVTEKYNRVSMHGVRESLLIKQAKSIGIPLYQIRLPDLPDMETYDRVMYDHLSKLKEEGITHSIFGDIFLQDLRTYRENKLKEVGLTALFPLWNKDTPKLIDEFIDNGYKTIIVCCWDALKMLCGKVIDANFVAGLPADVDPCGENGEFHTFAFEGPIFKEKIPFNTGELIFKALPAPKTNSDNGHSSTSELPKNQGFWYLDLTD
ncbi:diphthine--ammonia ligase [Pedobacter nototheniae]|uniref:Dph6-related ATP pyrophosphatase n=1 Tax=Pedobacter nototheniae TaxID=2488994 RepID=UPI00292CDA10|nr:diphthine--ammonia ligase [Pedobacter nototheniae]